MASELSCETSDDTSESELLDRSLSVWRGWSAIELGDFTPIALDIHTACSIGHYEWVRTIIRKNEGIDLDRKNRGGWTPLMYACYIGHDNIVSLLITAGCCNMNAKNPRGLTPLMLAASCGNESVAHTLIRRGANLELLDRSGWTALFHATYAGHQNFVAFLLEAEANKDAVDLNTGLTPFMVAASEGHEIIVQLFLQNGVNAHAKAFNGDMARSLALLNGYMKIVSLIDNQDLPSGRLRAEADLSGNQSSERGVRRRGLPHSQACPLNKHSPSIRDGPEAIARMINRSRQPDGAVVTDVEVPRGYVTFPAPQEDKKETRLSYRDVTSPINQEDYRDSSDSRDFDDFNDESNAFTKTGAITIKSSSSSSGGLMAALGLSLDSEDSQCSASGKFDDETDAPQPTVRPALASGGRDSAAENEQQEYDVDGDSSRPVDSHSPSLNDTSSLSSSDQRQKPVTDDQANGKQSEGNTNLALKDYFPLDSSFPPGCNTTAHAQGQVKKESEKSHHRLKPTSKSDEYLPKENMSQTEIVNRFLDNLSLNNSENPNAGTGGDCISSVPETEPNSEAGLVVNKNYRDLLDTQTCTCSEELEDQENKTAGKLLKGPIATSYIKSIPKQQQQHLFPSANTNSHEAFNYPPQLSPSSATSPPSQQQQWAPHPPLNHHHPLHNRHKHHQYFSNPPLPVVQDVNSNMYNILTSPNSVTPNSHTQNQPGINLPYLGNLPQQYFFADLHHNPYTPVQTNFDPPPPYQSLPGEDTVPVNIQTLYPTNSANQKAGAVHFPNSAAGLPPSAAGILHAGKDTGQSGLGVSNWGSPDPRSGSSNASQLSAQPVVQAAVSLPPVSEEPPSLPPTLAHLPAASPSAVPSSASVLIPGHQTSQPISSPQVLSSAVPSSTSNSNQGPQDLKEMLTQLGLLKYLDKFEEQDVDLQVFLSLTDNDLKELGIKLFGPRKKMTNAIARWHSCAPAAKNRLEQAYADKLEGEMQEMAIQLNQAYENDERLKAQVSQEQQLRSVTESCLMEERSGWEQACQMLQTTRGKLRTLGEQQSRLRHYQKELRKQFERWAVEVGNNNSNSSSSTTTTPNGGNSLHPHELMNLHGTGVAAVAGERSASAATAAHTDSPANNDSIPSHNGLVRGRVEAAAEQMKRSDKCLKEMMQTLSALVLNTDHILKSMQSLGNMSKDVT